MNEEVDRCKCVVKLGCMRLQGNIAGCVECCDQNMSVWVCSVALLGEYVCVCVCG